MATYRQQLKRLAIIFGVISVATGCGGVETRDLRETATQTFQVDVDQSTLGLESVAVEIQAVTGTFVGCGDPRWQIAGASGMVSASPECERLVYESVKAQIGAQAFELTLDDAAVTDALGNVWAFAKVEGARAPQLRGAPKPVRPVVSLEAIDTEIAKLALGRWTSPELVTQVEAAFATLNGTVGSPLPTTMRDVLLGAETPTDYVNAAYKTVQYQGILDEAYAADATFFVDGDVNVSYTGARFHLVTTGDAVVSYIGTSAPAGAALDCVIIAKGRVRITHTFGACRIYAGKGVEIGVAQAVTALSSEGPITVSRAEASRFYSRGAVEVLALLSGSDVLPVATFP